MSDITAKFTIQQNEPLQAKFTAYDEPPSVVVETKSYNELEDKPLINDVELVGNKTLDELGVQAKGDYALTSDIPDLTDYVKNTDYAGLDKAGLIMASSAFGTSAGSSGYLTSQEYTLSTYGSRLQNKGFVSKGTLENIKDDYVKRGVTENQTELTEDEKASAKNWLGFATPTEIMQAIASIPQFSISIVDELPLTGEKMTLYLVSKGGESPDVYDEYIWIEETSTFEFLGTTAVDLTDYVKNTDYANASKGGVIKTSQNYGTQVGASGSLYGYVETLEGLASRNNHAFISKGTLENIKDDYVKRGLTENTIEFTDEEKTSARTLIGAVGTTDYASNNKVGLISAQYGYGLSATSSGHLYCNVRTLEDYNGSLVNSAFISKGTLNNVLTQYKKVSDPMTEDAYNALETKDANTLYLIEE